MDVDFQYRKAQKHASYLKHKERQLESQRLRRRTKIQDRQLPGCAGCNIELRYTGVETPGSDVHFRCVLCAKRRAIALNIQAQRRWETRNPEAHKARSVIRSIRQRLKAFGFDLARFQRPSTKELAKVITGLPSTCQSCGTDQDLTIEHIKPVMDYPELALNSSNLTTLCRSCNTKSYHAYCASRAEVAVNGHA